MLALTVANLKMLARNRQAAFWALLFPLLLVVIFGLFDFKGVGSGSLAVVDRADNHGSRLLSGKLAAIEFLEMKPGPPDVGEGRRRLAQRKLDYLVVIPEDFQSASARADPTDPVPVLLYYNSQDRQRNQLVDGLVRGLVAETQPPGQWVPPSSLVTTEVLEVPEVDYFDEVLMGLIGFGIMTNSIISIAVRVSTYRNQSILKRLLVTPLPIWKYFAGEVSAHLVLAAVQVAIILLVGVFAFGASVHGNAAWIFLIALLGTLVFLNIGFILSAWARNPAAASGMGNAVALPMMFFAGTFFSTATLPWVLPHAAQVLPLTPMLDALRVVAIDSGQIWDTWPQLGVMGLWVLATAAVAVRVFRFS